jgi:hypothetical protein
VKKQAGVDAFRRYLDDKRSEVEAYVLAKTDAINEFVKEVGRLGN